MQVRRCYTRWGEKFRSPTDCCLVSCFINSGGLITATCRFCGNKEDNKRQAVNLESKAEYRTTTH